MKFSILQQDFLPALVSVSRVVGTRSNLPVLENILLSCEKNKLKLSATNLEIGMIKHVPCDVEEEGEVTIPSRTIVELISGLGQSKIEIESSSDILTIHSGKFKAEVNGIPATEFPVIPTSEEGALKFSRQIILGAAQIFFAAAVDEGRPVLTGVLTELKKDKLDFVATDGFRLARRQLEAFKGSKPFRILVPKKTYEEIFRILSEEEVDEVKLSATQNQIVFKLGSTIVSSRLIEGQFPNWEKIIPQQFVSRVLIDKEQFLKAIKLASVFSKNESNIIVLSIKKEGLLLESHAKQLGSQQNQVDAQIEGEELQVAFNPKYLQDALSASPSSQIMMELSGALSATLIKPVGVEGLEYLIMPVRLS